MKTNLSILIIGSVLSASCTTINMTYTSPNSKDDLYYSKADAKREAVYNEEVQYQDKSYSNSNRYNEDPQVQNPNAKYETQSYQESPANNNSNYSSNSEQSYSSDGKTIINNYYDDDDDDYGIYTTRINRFHRPYGRFDYYSPAYCGFYYDPFWNTGWNIGFGYSYGFGPSWGFGYNYGFYDPFYSPFYNPWYNPYYGYGGWGGYNAYGLGYRNGYFDGRYDNGYYGGGNYGGGLKSSNNTIIRGPRPSRGGNVSTAGGNRIAPERNGLPSIGSGSESIRSVPPTRTPINSNSNNTTIGGSDVRTIPTRETEPVRNTSGNGYIPPRVPTRSSNESSPNIRIPITIGTEESNIRRTEVPNRETIKVNPNFSGQSPNPDKYRDRRSEVPNNRRSEAPSRSYESPRMSTPSSPAPSRSSGGSSSPVSRPRPR